ncbi:ribonuclease H-like protein [Serendipita vermifera]|nr:ribonuclease H-like protein [Serendipita vermifera]
MDSQGLAGVVASIPLERAPDGSEPTSNRAELRAVLSAVEMRVWHGEGFDRLVIGTDSEYVVKRISEWCRNWKKNGWKTASGTPVKNQDLWTLLLEKIEKLESQGFSVQFFQLKRAWNEKADACAKKAAVSIEYHRSSFTEFNQSSHAQLKTDVPDAYDKLSVVGY